MSHLQGGIAVITGAASGFGLEACRIAAQMGMKIVMADVQADAGTTRRARACEGFTQLREVLHRQPNPVVFDGNLNDSL